MERADVVSYITFVTYILAAETGGENIMRSQLAAVSPIIIFFS